MSGAVIEIDGAKGTASDESARAVYEHPLPVRRSRRTICCIGQSLWRSAAGWAAHSSGT